MVDLGLSKNGFALIESIVGLLIITICIKIVFDVLYFIKKSNEFVAIEQSTFEDRLMEINTESDDLEWEINMALR